MLRSGFKTLILFTLLLGIMGCKNEPSNASTSEGKASLETDQNGLSKKSAILKTVHGTIEFKFYPKKAPNTTKRIIELIDSGFYNGLKFHRVVPRFVVQTGDPKGNGTGGSGKNLKAEFNDIKHVKGTVAMARSQDYDSADSQFYISLGTHPHLDGKYTVFGMVSNGLEIIEKIQVGDKILSLQMSK